MVTRLSLLKSCPSRLHYEALEWRYSDATQTFLPSPAGEGLGLKHLQVLVNHTVLFQVHHFHFPLEEGFPSFLFMSALKTTVGLRML